MFQLHFNGLFSVITPAKVLITLQHNDYTDNDIMLIVRMLIKVKTLTGKEIEVDIEPQDKVVRIKERLEEKEGEEILSF